jgi:hypothetical protein
VLYIIAMRNSKVLESVVALFVNQNGIFVFPNCIPWQDIQSLSFEYVNVLESTSVVHYSIVGPGMEKPVGHHLRPNNNHDHNQDDTKTLPVESHRS